ncbi:MAG: LytTR family transcriptional regulator [Bacteroidetes bacterium]|nr:LytTR family transcriptional regulator [Bacteroidota bacterium]
MEKKIPLHELGRTSYVFPSCIEFIEADGSYVTFHFTNGKPPKTITATLKQYCQLLKACGLFCSVHRSYFVNVNEIDGFDNSHYLIMNSKKPVPITEEGRKNLAQMGFSL